MLKLARKLTIAVLMLGFDGIARAEGESTPPAIKLHLENIAPHEVFAALTKQTGVAFHYDTKRGYEPKGAEAPPTSVSVDVNNKTFWTAMNELCANTKFQLGSGGDDESVALRFSSESPGLFGKFPLCTTPAATFLVSSIRHNSNIDLSTPDAKPERDVGIEMTIYVDPRLHVLQHMSQPAIETAVDENGKSLAVTPDPADISFGRYSDSPQWNISLFVPLDFDSNKSRKLATFKGALHVQLATQIETLEIDDLSHAEGEEKTVGGIEFHMTEVTDADKSFTFKFHITRKEASPELWNRVGDNLVAMIHVQCADGSSYHTSGGGSRSENEGTYTFTAKYEDNDHKPVKLHWIIPTAVEERDLQFEFKDLPLP